MNSSADLEHEEMLRVEKLEDENRGLWQVLYELRDTYDIGNHIDSLIREQHAYTSWTRRQ